MKPRLLIVCTGLLLLVSPGSRSVSAQSADPFFTTFSANYDVIYHEGSDTVSYTHLTLPTILRV